MSAAALDAANEALSARPELENLGEVKIVRWNPDASPSVSARLTIVIGPDACGMENRKKLFRACRIFGTGEARVLVFVDGGFVKEEVLEAVEDPEKSRLLWLPRGTNGYRILAVVSHGGLLESFDFLWDPIGEIQP